MIGPSEAEVVSAAHMDAAPNEGIHYRRGGTGNGIVIRGGWS
jgi:hypothetical protein